MEQIIIPFATALLGFLAANWKEVLGWQRRAQKEELDIGDQLMDAINDGRAKILEMYTIIDEMDAQNRHLKMENAKLTIERDNFKQLSEELREKLNSVSKDLEDCAKKVIQSFNIAKEHPKE